MQAPPPDTGIPAGGTRPASFGSGLKKRYVFLAGALYGLLMRLAFGLPFFGSSENKHNASEAMLWSFVCLVPLLVGALTVHFSGGRQRSFAYVVVAPWVSLLMFVAGTALLLIEGSICIAMALPLFLSLASVGGVAMWLVSRFYRPSASVLGCLLALPLMTGSWERGQPLPQVLHETDASVQIDASPEVIWNLINHADGIRPAEMEDGLAYRMGLPYPLSARTVETAQGRVRKLRWEKGVHFDEPISDWEQNRFIRWSYSFPAGAIPAEALDEHVVIGGKYFDLVDTSYRLTPAGRGTRLDIHVTYRISTNFNWYADPWGRLLVDDAAGTILGFYKRRAEALVRAADSA